MKSWNSYGSEHSANLVMIGRFKDADSAEKTKAIIDEIIEFMSSSNDYRQNADSYSEATLALLRKVEFHSVSPAELEHFRYDISSKVKDETIVIGTDEMEISAYLKLMIEKGARVEVFSAHDHPDPDGRDTTSIN